MLFEKLPLELVYNVVAVAVAGEETASDALRLRGVNRLFEKEVSKCFFREREHKYSGETWARVPYPFRLRWARDLVLGPRTADRKELAEYWTEVVDDLESYSKVVDAENSGLVTRQQWFAEVCEILALHDSDCQCGRPAFFHLDYTPRQVRDSAFHVAFIKRHTDLEIGMIRDGGASFASNCPYIQVHRADARGRRKNALEWAIQEGLTDTARRLLEKATADQKADVHNWKSTLWVAASNGNIEIIESLLSLEFAESFIPISIERAIREAAMWGHWDAVQVLCERFPQNPFPELMTYAAEQGQSELLKSYMKEGFDSGRATNAYLQFTCALESAASGGHVQLYRDLLDWWDQDSQVRDGSTMKERARFDISAQIVHQGSVELARLHVDRGFSLQPVAVVCHAASKGHVGLLKYLWPEKEKACWADGTEVLATQLADISRCSLILAVRGRHVETVQWLLERVDIGELFRAKNGANLPEDENLLLMAIDAGSRELTEILLKARVSPEHWPIDDFEFSSAARRCRADNLLDSVARFGFAENMSWMDFELKWAPQWQVDEALRIARVEVPL